MDFWLNILYLRGSGDERYPRMVAALEKAAVQDPELAAYVRHFKQ